MSINRRNFLRNSILTTTGAVLGSKALASDMPGKGETVKPTGIITRTLGRTGLVLPIVSMGVMRSDNPSLVKAALEKGMLHLDTAHGYQEGNNELMLGKMLKDYKRSDFIISTKVHPDGLEKNTGMPSKATTAKAFLDKFHLSLERLQLDFVDILYVHAIQARETVLHKPILKALSELKKEGKIRFAGVSTHTNMHLVMDAAVEAGIYDVVLTSYNFKMKDDELFQKSLKHATDAGLGIVGMKTMAGGFFDKERKQPVNAMAALKWALNNPLIHTTIPGFTSFEQLEICASVMSNITLTESELSDLEPKNTAAGLFCDGCRECVEGCPKHLQIPELMRAYMYTYGYGNARQAKEVLTAEIALDENPCSGCSECTARCHRGFALQERIADVSRLKDVPTEFLA